MNFGASYDASPIIAYDGSRQPSYSMDSYTPSTVPGCRTPHLWCKDGGSLYDAIGPEFTLLRFDPSIDVSALLQAAREKGVPLRLLDLDAPDTASGYDDKLVPSRPDQHVVWRGESLPADPVRLIDRIRGAGDATR